MRKTVLASASALAILAAVPAFAQQAPAVQQSATKSDVATFLQGQANGATSCNTASETSAQDTITITPPSGMYVYVTGVYFDVTAVDATGATQLGTISSTNLVGAPIWSQGTVAASLAGYHFTETYPTALKSAQPGVAVTLVPSAAQNAKVILCMRAAGYFAQ